MDTCLYLSFYWGCVLIVYQNNVLKPETSCIILGKRVFLNKPKFQIQG